jgi:hypothetical protein
MKSTKERDELVPDAEFRAEMCISQITLVRRDKDPKLAVQGWPPVVRVGGRKFRSRQAIEKFKEIAIRASQQRQAALIRGSKP